MEKLRTPWSIAHSEIKKGAKLFNHRVCRKPQARTHAQALLESSFVVGDSTHTETRNAPTLLDSCCLLETVRTQRAQNDG